MKRRRGQVDPLEDTDRDVDFHIAVSEASHNVALVHVMRGIFNLMRIECCAPAKRCAIRRRTWRCSMSSMPRSQGHRRARPESGRAAANIHLSFVQASLREAASKDGRKAGNSAAAAAPSPARARKRSDGDAGA